MKKIFLAFTLLFLLSSWVNGMALTLMSSAFKNGAMIPRQYTCDGENISPALRWNMAPEGTKSFTLIVDDPDAPSGDWVHWIIFNIPSNVREISEKAKSLPLESQIGINSWNKKEYGGPCPPFGVHRYFFRLYALDTVLFPKSKMDKKTIQNEMKGHILGSVVIIGKYERQ